MVELFSIGPFHVYFFGVMVALGVLVGTLFARYQALKRGYNEDLVFNLIYVVVISGVLGARLFYILFYNPSFYFQNPIEIFKITEGGLSIHGGLVTALVASYLYTRKKGVSFLPLADLLVPSVALAQGVGRVGCDVFGKPMENPFIWGINVGGQILHPAQVYEFILNYLLFLFLWRKSVNKKFDGEVFLSYLIAFPLIRGIVEFFRINPIVSGVFSISHLLSAPLVVIGLVAYVVLNKKMPSLDAKNIEEIDLKNSVLIVIGLIIASLVLFYLVQG